MLFAPWVEQNRFQRIVDGNERLSFGIDFLDEALGGISPSDICLLGARTGNGKMQLATQVALHSAKQSKDVYYFALEAEKDEIEMRMLYSEVARLFFALPSHERPLIGLRYVDWRHGAYAGDDTITRLENEAKRSLELAMACIYTVYRDKQFTVDDFCKQLEQLQGQASLIILDHLHYFDWTEKNEYDALRVAIKKIRDSALQHRTPIILVAHLRKSMGVKNPLPEIDDFHGSSDLSKIATQCVLLAQSPELTQSGNSATYFYIAKARAAGDAAGYVGVVGYNLKTAKYEPGYMLARARFGEPEIIADPAKCPRWTRSVRCGS